MPNINKTFVDTKNIPGEYRDDALKGFVLDITEKGVKTYKVNARIKGGRAITYTIGVHGQPWNTTAARKKAESILYTMKDGKDPRVELLKIKEEQEERLEKETIDQLRNELTIRRVFEEWCSDARVKQSTKTLYKQVVFKHLKNWLDTPMANITSDMISKRYDEVAKDTISSANNTFRALRRLYNWSIMHYEEKSKEPFLQRNPALALAKRKKWQDVKSRNDEYIADSDLKAWFSAASNLDNSMMSDYFMLLLLSGLRKSEAAGLRWRTKGKDDVDFKRGRFTVHDTKNGASHTLPMTDYIRALFERRKDECKDSGEYVFPGQGGRSHIRDIRFHQQHIIDKSKVEFTPHQLRRTFSYAAERCRLGITEHKKLLNHLEKSDVTTGHYSPREIDDLLEPLKLVEDFLLRLAGMKEKSKPTRTKAASTGKAKKKAA